MANQRGQDGSITIAGVAVDELRSWSLDGVTLEIIDDTVKGDTHRTFKGGIGDGGTMTISCWLEYTSAQQDIIDLINAGTGDAIAFVLLAAPGTSFTGNASPADVFHIQPGRLRAVGDHAESKGQRRRWRELVLSRWRTNAAKAVG